jgi:hypothetical protein
MPRRIMRSCAMTRGGAANIAKLAELLRSGGTATTAPSAQPCDAIFPIQVQEFETVLRIAPEISLHGQQRELTLPQ